jgi:phage tail sheath gpL-like
MAISFNDVPTNARASQTYIELAGEKKSLASLFIPPTGGLIGQYDPSKTAIVDYTPVKVVSADDVGSKCGFGSHIHRMALAMEKKTPGVFNQGGGVYMFPVPEAAGTAATDTITVTGTATGAGTLYFLIAGDLIQVAVAIGDTPTVIGDAIVTATAAKQNLPITNANVTGTVTNTAKFKGTAGNQIKVVVNPGGDVQEQANPAGVTIALGNADGFLSTGATDPSVEDIFFSSGADNLGDRWYTAFNAPFTDATNLAFHVASGELRKDPAVNRMFVSIAGYIKETYSTISAIPATINSEWISAIWEDRSHSPAFELAAAELGVMLDEQGQAPNRPYKTLETGIAVDDSQANLSPTNKDALYRAGMSYCTIDTTGKSRFGDLALTRRTNDFGADTEEWFDLVSLATRQAKAYSIEQLFLTDKYQRGVVITDDDVTAVDFAIAPKDVVADLTKLIQDLWAPQSWSKNIETILNGLAAEINASFEGRIDASLTDDEAKALRIIAVKYTFLY